MNIKEIDNFDISTTLRQKIKYKKDFWNKIKNEVLGKKYELSLVFIGDKLSRKLNKQFRNKDKIANIISFVITNDMGEIFINYNNVKKESKKWFLNKKKEKVMSSEGFKPMTNEEFIDFLFIHGLAHLKGYDHVKEDEAEKMEKFEIKMRKKFLS